MPSLEQLRNFKASFGHIADEAMVLSQLEIPLDDLPLPDSEPSSPPPMPVKEPPQKARPPDLAPGFDPEAFAGFTDPGDTDAEQEPPAFDTLPEPTIEAPVSPDGAGSQGPDTDFDEGLNFNFGDLLGSGLGNLAPPPDVETALEEAANNTAAEPAADGPGADTIESTADTGVVDNTADDAFSDIFDADFDTDFSNFTDIPSEPTDPNDTNLETGDTDTTDPFAGFEDSEFSESGDPEPDAALSGLGDTALDTDFPDLGDTALDTDFPGLGDTDLDMDFPDLGDTDKGSAETVPDEGDSGAGASATMGDMGLSEQESMALFAEGTPEDAAADTAEGSFDGAFPDIGEMNLDEEGVSDSEETNLSAEFPEAFPAESDTDMDAFDAFSPDGDSSGFGTEEEAGSPNSPEDFSLAGIDDVFGATTPIPGIDDVFTPESVAAAQDTVEEIRLNESEFDRLRQTIASYPLNLRIAIEEIIAEQAVVPELMSSLIKMLVRGASPKEAAALAGKILERTIPIPKGFEKKTGEALEEEQSSFSYIFIHKFLPVLRLFLIMAILAASLFYLGYEFIYTPIHANSIYKQGYELIPGGSYAQANEQFNRAFQLHRQKDWFYKYAEAFRDARQYIYAEEKYDDLLRHYPKDKKGALDYANMETHYLRNYAKADRIIRLNVLEYSINDKEGLLALGDNNLIWGEIDPSRYEVARENYARLLESYGWEDPIVERMLKYLIRVDNLGEVLPLQQYFMSDPRKRVISAATLAELGGYLLDKRFEEVRGVPNEHISRIEGFRDILIRAVQAAPRLPEAHYHLARYYNRFGNGLEERQTLEIAARAFDMAPEESTRRTRYRLDTQRRLAEIMIGSREFFAAEEQLIKGIDLYEDAVNRRFLNRVPEFGRLYADMGDLEYFTKSGNMPRALEYYLQAERNGWAPPEMQYRIGAAYYQQEQWTPALDRFFTVSSLMPLNRRLLNALGNASYMQGNYFHAQGYYNRLLDLLDAERARFPMLMPNDRPEHLELVERMMTTRNNLAVTLETLTKATGNRNYRSRALGLYTESARAWDSLTRDPATMVRSGVGDLSSPGINLAFLNSRNSLYPEPGYESQLYIQIDKDVLEPSVWEELVPQDIRHSDVVEQLR
jgi:tetratricopeptide (TPR) repeat protein